MSMKLQLLSPEKDKGANTVFKHQTLILKQPYAYPNSGSKIGQKWVKPLLHGLSLTKSLI